MLRRITFLLVLSGSAAIGASAPVELQQPTLEAQLQQARDEFKAARAEQQRLEKAASEARDEVTRIRAQQLAAAQAIDAAEAQITAADAHSRLVAAQMELQRRRLAREQAPVSALLGGLVMTARRPPILLLADSHSADDLVKLNVLVAATAPVIRARTAALSRELERGSRLQDAAVAARDDLARSRDELDKRRTAFAELEKRAVDIARRRGTEALGAGDVTLATGERLADVRGGVSSRRSSLQLAHELAELGPAPFRRSGKAPTPPLAYRMPATADVVDGLGAVSGNGVRSRGVTLATRRGTALVAPASGTILFAGPFRDYDGVVIIDHGDGWKSVLVNAGSKFHRGDKVRIGEPLGIALGPVEVQLRRKGEAVSPALIAGSSAMLSNGPKGG